jgi:hypothetical protein
VSAPALFEESSVCSPVPPKITVYSAPTTVSPIFGIWFIYNTKSVLELPITNRLIINNIKLV